MRRRWRRWLRGFAVCCAAWLGAGAASAADLAAGAARAEACAACHGPAGATPVAGAPVLAGQPDRFLQWQLVYFRSGTRKSAVMQPLAAALSDSDIRNLSAYYAAQQPVPSPAGPAADPTLLAAGKATAAQQRCASCHKDDFSGDKAAPRVAGQREDYLLKALRDFKAGDRTGGGVAAMADAVYPLHDDQLRALAHYLARLP